mgnify:CR=1 FL=1
MKEIYENKLFTKYPTIFPNGRKVNPRESLLYFGCECESGWFRLIDNLCKQLVKASPNVVADQVKEKFGGLRFYVHGCTAKGNKLIEVAEHKSFRICELCGKRGKLYYQGGWYLVRCAGCKKAIVKEQ